MRRPGPVARGGGWIGFCLRAGDRVKVIDLEGLQPAVLFASPAGLIDAPSPRRDGASLCDLSRDTADAATLTRTLTERGLSPTAFEGFDLAPPGSDAGAASAFRARGEVFCLLFAPGVATTPVGQETPTDLQVEILAEGEGPAWSAGPLASPKADIRIQAATAQAYRVAAGDYIQIIDLEGRQCSDFVAFDAAALAGGRERALDAAATRTVAGAAHPTPGLHARYFDQDLAPMVEIIQDTVGRHDTFMLACNAKYYDDLGYPGHANCTDNFNAALADHGVAPRKGWPAINFFYNTIIDAHGAITLDEPWSRPGDYVLLRALKDLVCASSSCADDIDPANAWRPTDIQVRLYDRANRFSPGTASRMTPQAEPKLTRETAFHARLAPLSRTFVDYKGFWLPSAYANAGPLAEYWACRTRAVVMDLSALRKFEVTGPDAERLLQAAMTRDIRKLAVGQVVYTAMCYEHGGMIDDGTVFRLGQNNFRWICGDDYCGVWLRDLARREGLKAFVRSSTDQLHNLAVQGPLSRDVLRACLVTPPRQTPVETLGWFRFTIGRIGDAPVVVSRTGYTGELGYEIWCHPKDGPAVWDAVWAAGAPHGLMPLGLEALDMVRIEAGLAFAGYEFCDQTDPFEAGIGFVAPAAKSEPYVGGEALARRRAAPQRRLVGLETADTETLSHGDPVHVGRAQVGVVTSAVRSPILRRTIALARVDIAHARLGTALEVGRLDGQQKRIPVTVTRFPHYDPDKSRVRA
jgi:aminomethyltransferase